VQDCPKLEQATLVLAFTGWMDGGDVSTGHRQPAGEPGGSPTGRPDRPGTLLHLQFPGVDGDRRPIPAGSRDRGRAPQGHGDAVQPVLPPRAGLAAVVRGERAEPAVADLRRLRIRLGAPGRRQADSIRRFLRRLGAPYPAAAPVCEQFSGGSAARNEAALRHAGEQLQGTGSFTTLP